MSPSRDYFPLFPDLSSRAGVPETQPPYVTSLTPCLAHLPDASEVRVVTDCLTRRGDQAQSSCMPWCAADRRGRIRTQASQYLHGHTPFLPSRLLLMAQVQLTPPSHVSRTHSSRASIGKPRGEHDGNGDGAALGTPLSRFSEVGTFALERKATLTFL